MHALIIDDSRAMRSILRRIVTDLGFETSEAGDGQEALDHARATGSMPDLCLIDWNMPVMDGYTFITRVRADPRWRDITLMMVTTESEHGQIVRALAAGAHEYVIKPFTAGRHRRQARAARPGRPGGPRMSVMTEPTSLRRPRGRRGGLVHVPRRGAAGPRRARLRRPRHLTDRLGRRGHRQRRLGTASSSSASRTPCATAVTDAMLGLDPGDGPRPAEDVADAVGELVNMIGGNVKSLMPGPSTLSLPLVRAGRRSRRPSRRGRGLPPRPRLGRSRWSASSSTVRHDPTAQE